MRRKRKRTAVRLLTALGVLMVAALGPGPAGAVDRHIHASAVIEQAPAVHEAGAIDRRAPLLAPAVQAQGSFAGVTDARHAGLLLRHRGDRSVESGLISRLAPADGIAANAPASISAPVVTGPADGFDYLDAFVGAIAALALVLLLLGAARLVQGRERLAHR